VRTELTADVTVVRYAVFAELAWLERRPELGMICQLGRQAGGHITPAVIQQALPGLADVASANVVRWCRDLGLCDPSGSLTGLGASVADTNEAPVPEQGVFDVWAAMGPLLGARMLHVERVTSTQDTRFGLDDIRPVPIEPERGRIFASVVDPHNRFVLRSFPSNHGMAGALPRTTNAQCRVRWLLDWQHGVSEVRLEGAIDTSLGSRAIKFEPEQVDIDLWRLMDSWAHGVLRPHGQWSARSRWLAVTFADLSVAEQESFTKELVIGDVEVPGFGHWSDVRLSEVPIGPATADDAATWAMRRLDRVLRDTETPLTRAEVRQHYAKVTESTPLASGQPTLPSHHTLLEEYRDSPEVYWRLAAAVDLAAFAPLPEELEPMTIGAAAPAVAPSSASHAQSIWMPFQSGWPMRTLVNQLISDCQPRRVLLVDKYVTGYGNLIGLKLFAATLASYGSPTLDIWTGDEVPDADITEIQQITGRRPQSYREVFGSARYSHERFLVVVPADDTPFAWGMSHSVLHARVDKGIEPTPETPLRWLELSANRLSIEQLRPQLAAWVNEGRS
jgi:hypothetical protein